HALVETLDLRHHLVRRAVHDHALLFLVCERLRADRGGAPGISALQRLDVERDRYVAGRVAILRGDLDVDVPGELARAALRVRLGVSRVDQRHECHAAAARQAAVAIGAAVGIEHLADLVVGLQKGREHVAAARHLADRVEVARPGDPDWRMRALIGPPPDGYRPATGYAP